MRAKAASNGAKKLVIKPLKVKPKLPDNFEDDTWEKLKTAVDAVHSKQPVSCSLEELYKAVEDLCTHKFGERLYNRLQEVCDAHIGRCVAGLREHLALDGVAFLPHARAWWGGHCNQMLLIRSIFLYLDRTYVIGHIELGARSLFDLGLRAVVRHLADHPTVGAKAVSGLLDLISAERRGDAVERPLLQSLLRMFHDLGTYGEAFQVPFLEQTRQFYAAEGERKMATASVPEYLEHCEARLAEEYERCQHYLEPGTKRPLIAVLEQELISRHMETLLDKGFADLMDHDRQADLGRLYGLCSRINFIDRLRLALRDYVRATGKKIVLDEEKDKEMVTMLLAFKSKMDAVLAGPFQGNEGYGQTLRDSFEHFINQRESKPAELIAKFIDGRLRAGNKGRSEVELETDLEHALNLFRFIQGKDVFEAFYKKDLAKRLLLGKSASVDAEKSMITKLKAECGPQFTTKLEGMFTDIDLSRDLIGAFKQLESIRSVQAADGVDLNVSVLTSGYWPTYPPMEIKLPPEMARYQELFKDFYLGKHGGRRLVWQPSLGHCTVRADFPKCSNVKELQVSLFQAVVLKLFNDAAELSFSEIKELTGIEDAELRRTLQSLACGKVRVIRKEPMSREVDDADVFSTNLDFTHPMTRIKINTIQMKETPEENKKTNDQVLQDRQYQIDAAIVRIMKTRKSLSHKLLIGELMTQLKFSVRALDLKKRIENLIDREYMERDANNKDVYNYLA